MKIIMLALVGTLIIALTACSDNESTPGEFVSPFAGQYVIRSASRVPAWLTSETDIFTIHSAEELETRLIESRRSGQLSYLEEQLLVIWDDEFFESHYLIVAVPIFDQRDGRFGGVLEDGRVVFYRFPLPSEPTIRTGDFQSNNYFITASNDFRPYEFTWVWVNMY